MDLRLRTQRSYCFGSRFFENKGRISFKNSFGAPRTGNSKQMGRNLHRIANGVSRVDLNWEFEAEESHKADCVGSLCPHCVIGTRKALRFGFISLNLGRF